jgi:acyl-CoA hydrolase/GNAT superfamily N-acetyltransferase
MVSAGRQTDCKRISFPFFCDLIRPGDRIFISSGPATPSKTMAMIIEADHPNFFDLEIIQLGVAERGYFSSKGHPRELRWKTFSVGETVNRSHREGNMDFIPSSLAEIPYLFHINALEVNVAIIQTSVPDSKGFVSLGVVADVADLVIKNAAFSIAEINPNVPLTHGDTVIHINQFDYFIESDQPLLEMIVPPPDEIADRIGRHVANIIEDDSTVALHVGDIFSAIATHLRTKKNIRICSHAISDWAIDLIESGALAFDRGIDRQGIITAGSCFGSRKLYDYVNNNPFIEIVPLLRSSYQTALQKIPKLVSIVDADRVDLTGNSVIPNAGDDYLPGFEGKLNLSMASTLSWKGKSIVAMRSVDENGNSNIVIFHNGSGRVRSTLGTTRYVVTEYGIADIAGKSIRERALAIIDIAHPAHRDALIDQTKQAGHINKNHLYDTNYAANYPHALETVKIFADNLEVKFRPIKPSDVEMMRRLFYSFSNESRYMRYFSRIRVMPHIRLQLYTNIDYTTVLSIVGAIQHKGTERIIAEARYSHDPESNTYELSFAVDDEYQGKGIARFMFDYLIDIARERGITSLYAMTMIENLKMARLFQSNTIKPEIIQNRDVVQYIFNLQAAKPKMPPLPNPIPL